MSEPEPLSQELARLVDEWNDSTLESSEREEAWNLIADLVTEGSNARAILAALSRAEADAANAETAEYVDATEEAVPVSHTKTPWALCTRDCISDGERFATIALCQRSPRIPLYEQEANAAFIVRAVNAHDALVAALKGLHDINAEYGRINNLGGYDNQDMKQARAALKLAGAP